MPLLMRTGENTLPAVTTELDFTTDDLLRFMLETNRFVDENGTISEERREAAIAYLNTNWPLLRRERWSSPGFDPENPFLETENPNWFEDPKITKDLKLYLSLKNAMEEQTRIFMSGPNKEYERANNALILCQRVDLWSAGPKEVEAAVIHLSKLGDKFNSLVPDFPEFISEYYAGAPDL